MEPCGADCEPHRERVKTSQSESEREREGGLDSCEPTLHPKPHRESV
jgi:hypothetical protein